MPGESCTPAKRARRIALKVDGLYHMNSGRWHDQWAKADAEAEDWQASNNEARQKKQDALNAIWSEVRAVEAGKAKPRLTQAPVFVNVEGMWPARVTVLKDPPPAEGWEWTHVEISDPADRMHVQSLWAWMPPEATIDPALWPRPTPSLAAQYLILAVLHDVVLPKGIQKILDAKTLESGAVYFIRSWNFGDGGANPSLKELSELTFEGVFHLQLSHAGVDRVRTYLNAVRADLATTQAASMAAVAEGKSVPLKVWSQSHCPSCGLPGVQFISQKQFSKDPNAPNRTTVGLRIKKGIYWSDVQRRVPWCERCKERTPQGKGVGKAVKDDAIDGFQPTKEDNATILAWARAVVEKEGYTLPPGDRPPLQTDDPRIQDAFELLTAVSAVVLEQAKKLGRMLLRDDAEVLMQEALQEAKKDLRNRDVRAQHENASWRKHQREDLGEPGDSDER